MNDVVQTESADELTGYRVRRDVAAGEVFRERRTIESVKDDRVDVRFARVKEG